MVRFLQVRQGLLSATGRCSSAKIYARDVEKLLAGWLGGLKAHPDFGVSVKLYI